MTNEQSVSRNMDKQSLEAMSEQLDLLIREYNSEIDRQCERMGAPVHPQWNRVQLVVARGERDLRISALRKSSVYAGIQRPVRTV